MTSIFSNLPNDIIMDIIKIRTEQDKIDEDIKYYKYCKDKMLSELSRLEMLLNGTFKGDYYKNPKNRLNIYKSLMKHF